jgi:hypothetical protein
MNVLIFPLQKFALSGENDRDNDGLLDEGLLKSIFVG